MDEWNSSPRLLGKWSSHAVDCKIGNTISIIRVNCQRARDDVPGLPGAFTGEALNVKQSPHSVPNLRAQRDLLCRTNSIQNENLSALPGVEKTMERLQEV